MQQEIKLSNGFTCLVDDDDFQYLKQFNWHYTDYAYRVENKKRIWMHKEILNVHEDSLVQVDHINHNKLDNRKENLRTCSAKQNLQYRSKVKSRKGVPTSSKYIGVYFKKKEKLWSAGIYSKGNEQFLGGYESEEDAARAYNVKAKEIYGEFAPLNDVTGWEDFKITKERNFNDCITGVTYRKNREIYEVRVVITRSNVVYVGSFKNIEDAVLAYNNYVIEHKLNKKLNII